MSGSRMAAGASCRNTSKGASGSRYSIPPDHARAHDRVVRYARQGPHPVEDGHLSAGDADQVEVMPQIIRMHVDGVVVEAPTHGHVDGIAALPDFRRKRRRLADHEA